jgi:hypothetical protein
MTASNVKLTHSVIVKSPGLLPMLYTVAELAHAIGAVDRTLRDWLAGGAPHLRDADGHIWISGREFAKWVASMCKSERKPRMKDNQAYCMHCRTAVQLIKPETRHMSGKLTLTSGRCSVCGGRVHRGGRMVSNPAAPLLGKKGARI